MPIAITQPSYHHYQKLNHHISASLFAIAGAKRAMVTGSSSSSKARAMKMIIASGFEDASSISGTGIALTSGIVSTQSVSRLDRMQ